MFEFLHCNPVSRLRSSLLLVTLLVLLTLQPSSTQAATLTVCASGCGYTTIQAAINAAANGDTISIAAGTYNENLTINGKYLTLEGAGSGDSAADTIIQGMINVQSGGASASNRQTLRGLRVAGAGATGIQLNGNYITLSAVTVTNKTTNGVLILTVNDLIVEDSTFVNNRYGLRVDGKGANNSQLVGAVIRDSQFIGGEQGLLVEYKNGGIGRFNDIQVVDTSFESNTRKGIYIEMGNNLLFNRITVDGSGMVGNPEVPTTGIDINLKYGAYANIEIRDSLVTNSGVTGTNPAFPTPSAIDIKTRDDGSYAGNPASATNVRLTRVTVENNPNIGIRFGEAGKDNGGLTAPVITQSNIINNGGDGLVNTSKAAVIAENNWWGCNEGPNAGTCETVVNVGTGSVDFTPWLTDDVGSGEDDSDDDEDADSPVEPPAQTSTFGSGEIGAETGGAVTTSGNPNANVTALIVNGEGNLAAVGDPNLISMGVVQAVDVFSFLPGGVLATTFDPPITVCLQGAGTVYFRPASDQTGTFSPIATSASSGTACVTLSQPGLLVLVGTTVAVAPAAASAPAGSSTPLNDCQVTTDFLLRLRQGSGTDSDILTRLPMGTSLEATERVDGWYRVIYGDQQGWVSADYVSTSGNCG